MRAPAEFCDTAPYRLTCHARRTRVLQSRESDTAVTLVDDGARRTSDGAAIVAEAHDAFTGIDGSIGDMTSRIRRIAAASRQIAASVGRLRDEIGEAAGVASSSSASASASAEEGSASTE